MLRLLARGVLGRYVGTHLGSLASRRVGGLAGARGRIADGVTSLNSTMQHTSQERHSSRLGRQLAQLAGCVQLLRH
jgi:hypothetical protein